MRYGLLITVCTVVISGCADFGSIAGCTMLATVANTRSSSIRGTVDGQNVRSDVTWAANRGDSGFIGIDDCLAAVKRDKGRAEAAASVARTQWASESPLNVGDAVRVVDGPVVTYDAPSFLSNPLQKFDSGASLEVVVVAKEFIKVRDQAGGISWVEKTNLRK